ncbi:hypothetical protein [Chitinophaga sp. YIM B06452]|uniref:hypothetical protein n=1 Tax=Chitinophaga sp. YIM B06452 TaxID=3082158 RepID=UPI0031FEE821
MKHLLLLLLVFPLLFVSCSKEGPAGPEGTQGPQGLQGPQGPQGTQGAQGNANVRIYEKDISTMTWTASGTYSYLNVPAPNVLTSDVLANSTILVYVMTSDFGGGWGFVPYHTERNIRVTAEVRIGSIMLRKDQNGSPTTQSWHHRIRVVIIRNTATGTLSRTQQSFSAAEISDQPAIQLK